MSPTFSICPTVDSRPTSKSRISAPRPAITSMGSFSAKRMEWRHAAERQIAQENPGEQLTENRRLLHADRELAAKLRGEQHDGKTADNGRDRIYVHDASILLWTSQYPEPHACRYAAMRRGSVSDAVARHARGAGLNGP